MTEIAITRRKENPHKPEREREREREREIVYSLYEEELFVQVWEPFLRVI